METKHISLLNTFNALSGAQNLKLDATQVTSVVAQINNAVLPISVDSLKEILIDEVSGLVFEPVEERTYPLNIKSSDIGFQLFTAIALYDECPS